MNKWIAKGRLAKNPEIRYTQSGTAVASFTLACDRRKRKDAPPDAPTADFINCVAWDKLAQTIGNYCGKGKEIAIEAHLQSRSYEDKHGVKRYVTEAVLERMEFCGKKDDGGALGSNGYENNDSRFATPVPDEEIPF